MKQQGKIQIGDMTLDAEIEIEMKKPPMSEEQKIEIGRMIREGVSREGIHCIIEAWQYAPPFSADSPYATFVEYGKPPEPAKVVEGSLVEPITNPERLLE